MNELDNTWRRNEEEYHRVAGSLGRAISAIAQLIGEERDEAISRARQRVDKAKSNLDTMKIDIRASRLPSHQQQKYKKQLKVLENQLASQERDLERAVFSQQRKELTRTEKEERQRLLHMNEAVDGADYSLQQSIHTLARTEALGADITTNLNEQRGQLENTKDHLVETNAISERARRVLVGMARRTLTDRLIQVLILLVELAIIGMIVYFKFIKK